jgi:hypothetical protein
MNGLIELCMIPVDTREGARSPVVQSRGLFHSAVDTFCLDGAIPRGLKELKPDVILCRSTDGGLTRYGIVGVQTRVVRICKPVVTTGVRSESVLVTANHSLLFHVLAILQFIPPFSKMLNDIKHRRTDKRHMNLYVPREWTLARS